MTDSDWEPHVDRRARKPKRKAKSQAEATPEERREEKLRRRMIEQLRNFSERDVDYDEEDL